MRLTRWVRGCFMFYTWQYGSVCITLCINNAATTSTPAYDLSGWASFWFWSMLEDSKRLVMDCLSTITGKNVIKVTGKLPRNQSGLCPTQISPCFNCLFVCLFLTYNILSYVSEFFNSVFHTPLYGVNSVLASLGMYMEHTCWWWERLIFTVKRRTPKNNIQTLWSFQFLLMQPSRPIPRMISHPACKLIISQITSYDKVIQETPQ
jgi:hypothetical protein